MKGRTTVYNAGLVTDEKWAKVNDENKELLAGFMEYLDGAGKSPATLKQYDAQLRIIMVYISENAGNKCFVDMKKREWVKFAGWLQNTLKVNTKRIQSMKSVISSFSNYIELVLDEDYPDFKNISKVIAITQSDPIREKTILSEEEIYECLNKLVEARKYQVACFMALLFASGMRKAEAIQMTLDDFTEETKVTGGVFYHTHEIRTKGAGKNGKRLRKFVFCDVIDPYLKLWLDERKRKNIDVPWLFVQYEDGGYECAKISTANSFARTITNYLGQPGYCHNFRHAWCTYLHKKGYSETKIQKLQGWAGLEMVSLYNDTNEEEELEDFFLQLAAEKNGETEEKEENKE